MAFVTVKTYSQSLWTPGTTLTNDIPPCQMGKTEVFAIAGYKVQLAGIPLAAGDTEIWRAEYVKYLEDKPCSLTGKM